MSKQILKDLSALTEAGIINSDTAESIRSYYIQKANGSPNRLMVVFAILGALLVGLGVCLIIAHNWDDLSKEIKLIYALLPLLLGQAICGYTLLKRHDSTAWRESGGVFLFFAIAASIAIVSQVYNMPDNFSGFLFIWMLLSIPLVYVMQSAMTSLLVILGMTTYACTLSYFDYPTEIAWYYWVMFAAIIPFFLRLVRRSTGNFVYFHRWFFALSLTVVLNMFNQSDSFYMFVAYMSLFSFFILLGETENFSEGRIMSNAFLVLGNLGSTCLLLLLTFRFFWDEIAHERNLMDEGFVSGAVISVLTAAFLVYSIRKRGVFAIHPMAYLFLVFILLFEFGKALPPVAPWIANILVLGIAVLTTWRGADRDNMFILNYGLLIMAVLILCRFFDTDMSFVVRGILFLIVGTSFFGANYWVLQRRKLQDL